MLNEAPPKKADLSIVLFSAAEHDYQSFVAATGSGNASVEMRYEDESLWLTRKDQRAARRR